MLFGVLVFVPRYNRGSLKARRRLLAKRSLDWLITISGLISLAPKHRSFRFAIATRDDHHKTANDHDHWFVHSYKLPLQNPSMTSPIVDDPTDSPEGKEALNVCASCLKNLTNGKSQNDEEASPRRSTTTCCCICLGAQSEEFSARLTAALEDAIRPYGGFEANKFSFNMDVPTIVLPADLAYRFHVASKTQPAFKSTCSKSASRFGQELKEDTKRLLCSLLRNRQDKSALDKYPSCIKKEEQGHLSIFITVTTADAIPRPEHMLPAQVSEKKARRQQFNGQGGNPISNLAERLRLQGKILWPMNRILDAKKLPAPMESEAKTLLLANASTATVPLDFHVAVWRRSLYLKACYTKGRRDVSQTPFIVSEQGKRRKLGSTSVEEEILPAIASKCGGISTLNNDKNNDKVIFGMAKFHGSGREDIDVRMLLPDSSTLPDSAGHITGRPFACEIIDPLRLPSAESLVEIVHQVNHTTAEDTSAELRSYGRNPFGVCISPDLSFVPASAFANLQAETENKVKYYGCRCWSKDVLPDSKELTSRLGTFPLELHQQTPIRVVHRRNNTVRIRHVLTCSAIRIDDHYFQLHISTDAGTYVKEFVHGDLGRTVPNVSTLLGCKTDILELDCEGIQES